jgi:hypothetical protein
MVLDQITVGRYEKASAINGIAMVRDEISEMVRCT